uniref:Uncharacterized protein n=1 Tax=Anguilla anguilla TaxID=7936 RepID=A0A0E9RTU6_ANGAN
MKRSVRGVESKFIGGMVMPCHLLLCRLVPRSLICCNL